MAKAEERTGPVAFLQDSWVELKKVHPPTKQETFQAAVLVTLMVIFFSLFLGLADFLVGNMMEAIFK